jgi:hypothetical protein
MIPSPFKEHDYPFDIIINRIIDHTSEIPTTDEYWRYTRNKVIKQVREKLINEGWKLYNSFDTFKLEYNHEHSKFTMLDGSASCTVIFQEVVAKKYCYLVFSFENHTGRLSIGWKNFMQTTTAEILTEFLL